LTGKQVTALLTDMSAPIGYAIGNAMETAEAFEVLHGCGPEDLQELTYALGAEMLRAGSVASTSTQAARMMKRAVESGAARRKMREIVAAQGGDPRVVDEPDRLPVARHRKVVEARESGFVTGIDALQLGYASMGLGAGRTKSEDEVDPGAGIHLHVRIGDRVRAGAEIATLYASKSTLLDAALDRVSASFRIGGARPATASRIVATIRK
jgi:thymidine phosphorylase